MTYTDYLTPDERLQIYREAAAETLAESGITVEQFNDMLEKSAQAKGFSFLGMGGDILKTYLGTALLYGVPAGTLMYALSESGKSGNKKVRRLQNELDYYNDTLAEMKSRMAATGGDETVMRV